MKTTREVFKETLDKLGFSGYKPNEMTNSDYWLCTTTAMEEYRNQQPDTQPIDKLFELKEYTPVWIKWKKSGSIDLMYYGGNGNIDWLRHESFYGDEILEFFESFVVAEIPKF